MAQTSLVKWVRCEVTSRAGFDRGQRGWAALAGTPGLRTQFGGWSLRHDGVAHIFGLWTDRAAYDKFMTTRHDELASGQAGTYSAIRVGLLRRVLEFGPVNGAVLRLAHCRVHPDRIEHFEWAQRSVWNPGMSASPGMIGGVFAAGEPGEYLVLSAWRSLADHEAYVAERFPALRLESQASLDLAGIAGDVIEVSLGWTIT